MKTTPISMPISLSTQSSSVKSYELYKPEQQDSRPSIEATIRNRQLINRYIEDFCVLYRYHLIRIEGVASNLERYIGRQMATSYINNAELKSGQHFRTVVNPLFDVKELRATLCRQTSTDND